MKEKTARNSVLVHTTVSASQKSEDSYRHPQKDTEIPDKRVRQSKGQGIQIFFSCNLEKKEAMGIFLS
jgi:hypothetical protein